MKLDAPPEGKYSAKEQADLRSDLEDVSVAEQLT